jgi:uncharacterized membrane protein YgdD (TMEM256/DUF423 family)
MPKNWLIIGSLMAAATVAIGAFGAHGLKDLLLANGRTETFETAVRYQFYHTFAILFLGLIGLFRPQFNIKGIAVLFLIGILIFSGSLYLLCLTNLLWLGAITPIGGLSFIISWIWLAIKLYRDL